MPLSEHIRHQREKLGFSQELLAEKIGVSRQAVSKWETGLSFPSTQKLVMLADLFGISVTELLHGKEKAVSPPKAEEAVFAPEVAEQGNDFADSAPRTNTDAGKITSSATSPANGYGDGEHPQTRGGYGESLLNYDSAGQGQDGGTGKDFQNLVGAGKGFPCYDDAEKGSQNPGGAGRSTENAGGNAENAGANAENGKNSHKNGKHSPKKRNVAAVLCAVFVCLAVTVSAVLLQKPWKVPSGEVSPTAGLVSAEPTGEPTETPTELPSAAPSLPHEKEYFANRFPEKGSAPYLPTGATDEELSALAKSNPPTAEAPVSFLTYDYRSTGVIYAVTREIYDTFPKIGNKTVRDWVALDKNLCGFRLDGQDYLWSTYDNWYWETQPYAKEVDGVCYLWFSDIVGLSDKDGGWFDRDRFLLYWYEPENGTRQEARCTFYCKSRDRLTRAKTEGSTVTFLTDEALFSDLPFTGKGFCQGEEVWYALAKERVGMVSAFRKYPPESLPIEESVLWLSSSLVPDEVEIFAMRGKDGQCYLKIEYYTAFPWYTDERMSPVGRALFCWMNADGAICQQTFICREQD